MCWGTGSGSPVFPSSKSAALSKIKWFECTRKLFSVPSGAWAHFVCNLCAARGLPIPQRNVVAPRRLSSSLPAPTACGTQSNVLPRRKLFGLLIFAGSQSRVANKTFAKGRTQCALPVMLMLSCSHAENVFLSLHCRSSTLPLPL